MCHECFSTSCLRDLCRRLWGGAGAIQGQTQYLFSFTVSSPSRTQGPARVEAGGRDDFSLLKWRESSCYSKKRVLFAGEQIWRMAWRVCAKKAPTRLRWVRDSPWAQESSSGYSTSVCRTCCRACSICRRCGASLRSATTSLRPAAQKQVLFHVFAREDNGSKVLD